jgi:hypothetical protein
MEATIWRKSSWSTAEGNCVEAGQANDVIMVRDTKQHGPGPVLTYTTDAWRAFTLSIKTGASA